MKKIILILFTFCGVTLTAGLVDLSPKEQRIAKSLRAGYSTKQTVVNSYQIASTCIAKGIEGDFVECGVAVGHQIVAMAKACNYHKEFRKIHLLDSFEGFPMAGPKDTQQPGVGEADPYRHNVPLNDLLVSSGVSSSSEERVRAFLLRKCSSSNNFFFYKGWFQNTLPKRHHEIEKIAFLRLDGDLYESTKVCLEYLYPKVVKGGFVVIDDWALEGCQLAVKEYLDQHNLSPKITPVKGGKGPVFWEVD